MKKLIDTIRGCFTLLLLIVNTVCHFALMFPMGVIKVCLPLKSVDVFFTKILDGFGESWISVNQFIFSATRTVDLKVYGDANLKMDDWYLCVANHQTWVDILIIQFALNRKIPFLKFFIKQELIWIPILGITWWAMDYPFMKRHSKEEIKKTLL